jgi:hypothetical protein
MFELFSDIYFVVYKLYYIDQNNNLDIRVSLKKWDRGVKNTHLAAVRENRISLSSVKI